MYGNRASLLPLRRTPNRMFDRARPVGRRRGRVRREVGPPRGLQRVEGASHPPCVEVAAGAGHVIWIRWASFALNPAQREPRPADPGPRGRHRQPPLHTADRPRLRRAEDRAAGQPRGERDPACARWDVPVDVPLHVTYNGKRLARFAYNVDLRSYIRRRNARLTMTVRRMKLRRARMGWSIDQKALASDSTCCSPTPMRCASSAPSAGACPEGERERPAQADTRRS